MEEMSNCQQIQNQSSIGVVDTRILSNETCDDVATTSANVDEKIYIPDSKVKLSPIVINRTEFPIIVYQCRAGFLFNKQCLLPNEAVGNLRSGCFFYDLIVEIGDESCLPGKLEGMKSVVVANAVPAAFCAGLLVSVAMSGALAGPAAALSPLVSGLVVNGVVIDSAAITVGVNAAGGAKAVVDKLLKEKEDNFSAKRKAIAPSLKEKMFKVSGGINVPLKISEIKKPTDRELEKQSIVLLKKPIN